MSKEFLKETEDYDAIKGEIFVRANSCGPVGEIESWWSAFPEIDFIETDETFSGEKIDWDKRTMAERAFYVAYMRDPGAVKVSYELEAEGLCEAKVIEDSEKIWWMWLDGCFSGEELDERALKSFLWYANENNLLALKSLEDLDLKEVMITRLEAKVLPF